MSEDPSYLLGLGELASLKNVLGGWFHQDVWDDYATLEEAIDDVVAIYSLEDRVLLCKQIQTLAARSDEEIETFILKWAGGFWFDKAAKYREWLLKFSASLNPHS